MPQPKLSRRSTGLPPTRMELEEECSYQSIREGKRIGEPARHPQDNEKFSAGQRKKAKAKLREAVAEVARRLRLTPVESAIRRVYYLAGSYQLAADVRIGTVVELWLWECGEWRGASVKAARRLSRANPHR